MSNLAKTIIGLVETGKPDELQLVVEKITPTIAGKHDPTHAAVRSVIVQATKQGLIDPVDEILVNAIKDGGDAAVEALEILRSRMAATIHYLACKSGIDYDESDMQITEGLWEAARRYDNAVAKEKGARFQTYAHPWMKKLSRPRSDLKPGRKDRPFKHVFSQFESSYEQSGVGDSNGDRGSRSDVFFAQVGLFTSEDPSRALDVRHALASLDAKTQEVVMLRFMEGRSVPEVAKMAGLSVWQVKSLSNKAQDALRDALKGYE